MDHAGGRFLIAKPAALFIQPFSTSQLEPLEVSKGRSDQSKQACVNTG